MKQQLHKANKFSSLLLLFTNLVILFHSLELIDKSRSRKYYLPFLAYTHLWSL